MKPIGHKARVGAVLGLALLIGGGGAACRREFKSGLPVVTLKVNGVSVRAEVAATQESRTTGLMFRRELCRDCGMLFVFPGRDVRSFWMKNTRLPLSIAYLDDKGTILNIEDMEPLTETGHPSKGKAQYALEMNRGWFAHRGVKPGDAVGEVSSFPSATDQ